MRYQYNTKQKIILLLYFLLFLPAFTKAQRIGVGFEYQIYGSKYFYNSDSIKGNISNIKYKKIDSFYISRINDEGDTTDRLIGRRLISGIAFGPIISIHKRNWNIQTGVTLSSEGLYFVLGKQSPINELDTLEVSIKKISLKFPFRFQYSFLPLFKKYAYLIVELGFNYVPYEKITYTGVSIIKKNEVLSTNDNDADNELTKDIKEFTNFQHNKIEYKFGIGIMLRERIQLIIRDKFYFNNYNGHLTQFHFIGLSLIGNLVKGRLLNKRKIYD